MTERSDGRRVPGGRRGALARLAPTASGLPAPGAKDPRATDASLRVGLEPGANALALGGLPQPPR